MSKSIRFWLARFFGTPHHTTNTSDGVRWNFQGYIWRGTFYVWHHKSTVINKEEFKKVLFNE